METNDRRISTDDVMARLERASLTVTANMLGQDVKAGHLPKLAMDPRGPKGGIGRWWEPWVMQRALYLYRLRRRGVRGDLLRVLLFLHDGREWERVKPICAKGMSRMIDANRRPLRRRLRTSDPDPKTMHTLAYDIAEDVPMTLPTAHFIYGMGMYGTPLSGGSIEPMARAMSATFRLDDALGHMGAVQEMLASLGLTWDHMIAIVEGADAERAQQAQQLFRQELRVWRRQLARHHQANDIHGQSTNPLTLCGQIHAGKKDQLRDSPGRITAAQLLAGYFGVVLVAGEFQQQLTGSEFEP